MSGEFGRYGSGYLWAQVENAAADCADGSAPVTRALGRIFDALTPLSRAVCWHEAGDSGSYYPITEAIRTLPDIKKAVSELESAVEVYDEVAKAAIREYERGKKWPPPESGAVNQKGGSDGYEIDV